MPEMNEDSSDLDSVTSRRPVHTAAPAVIRSGREVISAELALTVFRQMIRTRALEERSIKMSKSGEAYFWIGGPGEEAFNVCLGLQVHKGFGPAYDYLHLHYRNAGVMLAMGMPMIDHIRQLAMRRTDPHSRGRNFVGHYAVKAWNVVPVTSVIEVQFAMAPGTALVQKRHGGEGITVVVGGEAGTAEGDFETCLNWSTRPGQELPVLMLVANNRFGISTDIHSVSVDQEIATRGVPYGIRSEVVDGNDPVLIWNAIDRAMRYCRRERKPFLLEAMVSRLHGHSSSSGAQRVWSETDVLATFEQKLIDCGAIDTATVKAMKDEAKAEADEAVIKAMKEPEPTREDVCKFSYAPSAVDAVYPSDFTGLPGAK
ncbi:MAG: thiamine pyrophosphate-dependent dehydrogenase E1 component subunit alpha [Gemmataceae bacterium]